VLVLAQLSKDAVELMARIRHASILAKRLICRAFRGAELPDNTLTCVRTAILYNRN
jgi:hypothetical protein